MFIFATGPILLHLLMVTSTHKEAMYFETHMFVELGPVKGELPLQPNTTICSDDQYQGTVLVKIPLSIILLSIYFASSETSFFSVVNYLRITIERWDGGIASGINFLSK